VLNVTEIVIDAFVERLAQKFRKNYGNSNPDYESMLAWVGHMALENIANSDALYHDVEHTILVTEVGQEILRGKHIAEGGVSPKDWFHFTISLICHDIGYVRGVCLGDGDGVYATGRDGETITLDENATDAALTPCHVDRGKLFVTQRFGYHETIDAEIIKRNIELTRFPVPEQDDQRDTTAYPGLLRASDLIGQLSDPGYLRKLQRLFLEFEETGVNQRYGYRNPGDLRRGYPELYWQKVYPYIGDALSYLSRTQNGKQIIANLYANVFVAEHETKA